MATTEKLREKLLILESKLEALGHIPSQAEDRALHANIKYYYNNYPGNPIVIRLKEKYPWGVKNKRNQMSTDETIDYIVSSLDELGYIPGPTENRELYSKVKYYYANYADDPRIVELMARFPFERKKAVSMFAGLTFDEKIDLLEAKLEQLKKLPFVAYGVNDIYYNNIIRFYNRYPDCPRIQQLMMRFPTYDIYRQLLKESGSIANYFTRCIEISNKLPGEKAIPMYELMSKCRNVNYSRKYYNGSIIPEIQLVEELVKKGFESEKLNKLYERILKANGDK